MHNLQASSLTKLPVSRIEDLGQAVLRAGLRAQHIETGTLHAHLAFVETGRMVCSTGLLGSKILLSGTLSETDITLGVGLRITEGSLQWLRSIDSGTVGVFLPGDEHHALYMPGSMYLAVTLSKESLAEEAEQLELLFDPEKLNTGHHERKLPSEVLMSLFADVIDFHEKQEICKRSQDTANSALEILVSHLARNPGPSCGVAPLRRLGQVARRALDYIESNLQEDISVSELARAAGTSRRTLHRAFERVLSDTPMGFTARRKLHGIRGMLRSCPELSVTQAAAEFSVLELGRFAARYRHQFGETPSKTRHDAMKI